MSSIIGDFEGKDTTILLIVFIKTNDDNLDTRAPLAFSR